MELLGLVGWAAAAAAVILSFVGIQKMLLSIFQKMDEDTAGIIAGITIALISTFLLFVF